MARSFVRTEAQVAAATRGECPTCGDPIYSDGTLTMTSVGYFGGLGQHRHDDNCVTRNYGCRNGHWWTLSVRRSCGEDPTCEWRGKESCDCHGGPKLDAWPPKRTS